MPRPSTLALHNDPVENLVKRLPPAYRNALQQQQEQERVTVTTRNLLRLLATKIVVGTLGHHDRSETRAAAFLDYVLKSQHPEHQQLRARDLAKCVGLKESSFMNLYVMMGHYYHDLVAKENKRQGAASTGGRPPSHGQPAKRKEAPSTTSRSAAAETTSHKQPRQSRRIQAAASLSNEQQQQQVFASLSIRLASHLSDPHGVARRARVLFHDIYAHAMASLRTAPDRRGQEYDFTRYATAYQAAVLFYVATTMHHDAAVSVPRRNNFDEEGGTTVRPLKMEDLVRACSDCTVTDVRQKLACVTTWAQELEQKRGQVGTKRSTTKSNKNSPRKTSKKTLRDDTNESTTPMETQETENTFDFSEWKESVLAPVLERTKAVQEESNGKACDRESLLQLAADQILAKYGLV